MSGTASGNWRAWKSTRSASSSPTWLPTSLRLLASARKERTARGQPATGLHRFRAAILIALVLLALELKPRRVTRLPLGSVGQATDAARASPRLGGLIARLRPAPALTGPLNKH